MTNPNPATPAQAATPGSGETVVTTPPSGTPAPATPGVQGNESGEGKVTIDLKEYRDLQRAKARTLSFDKRAGLRKPEANPGTNSGDGDPELVERLNKAESDRQAAERRALQAEVKGSVRDLLDREEFKPLPESTRQLILKNPAMLSEADNLEEALLDIEEFVRDEVLKMGTTPKVPTSTPNPSPAGHETPPTVTPGSPAPSPAAGMEDLSKLRGADRSRAAIRNAMRGAGK